MDPYFSTENSLLRPGRFTLPGWTWVFLLIGAMLSCRERQDSPPESSPMEIFLGEAGEWSYVPEDSLCYMDLSAAAQGDTFAAQLIWRGDHVQGTLWHNLQDGSARYGKLKGEKRENRLVLDWHYLSEGNFDSLRLEFQIQDRELIVPGSLQTYSRVDCDQIPRIDFDLGL